MTSSAGRNKNVSQNCSTVFFVLPHHLWPIFCSRLWLSGAGDNDIFLSSRNILISQSWNLAVKEIVNQIGRLNAPSIITESCAAYLWRYDLISSFTAVHIFAPISIQAKGVGDKPPTDFEIGPTLSACSRCDLFNDLRSTSLVVSTRSGYTKGSTCREKRRGI